MKHPEISRIVFMLFLPTLVIAQERAARLEDKPIQPKLTESELNNITSETSKECKDAPEINDTVDNFACFIDNGIYKICRSGALSDTGLKRVHKNFGPFKTVAHYNAHGFFDRPYSFFLRIFGKKGGFVKKHSDFARREAMFASRTNPPINYLSAYSEEGRYIDGKNPLAEKRDKPDVFELGEHLSQTVQGRMNISNDFLKKRTENPKYSGGKESFLYMLDSVLEKNNSPYLFHCTSGKHRTGMMAMAIRAIQSGYLRNGEWRKNPRSDNQDWIYQDESGKLKVSQKLKDEYCKFNPNKYRQENVDFIEDLINDEDFKKNYLSGTYYSALNDVPVRTGTQGIVSDRVPLQGELY